MQPLSISSAIKKRGRLTLIDRSHLVVDFDPIVCLALLKRRNDARGKLLAPTVDRQH